MMILSHLRSYIIRAHAPRPIKNVNRATAGRLTSAPHKKREGAIDGNSHVSGPATKSPR